MRLGDYILRSVLTDRLRREGCHEREDVNVNIRKMMRGPAPMYPPTIKTHPGASKGRLRALYEAACRDDPDKYRDISWLMKQIDPEEVLVDLFGIDPGDISISGDEITTYCPDHHLFAGRDPSHPKWSMNMNSGLCKCFTEGRGSNLLWTAKRLWDCSVKEAVRRLTGYDEIDPVKRRERIERRKKAKVERENLEEIEKKQFRDSLKTMRWAMERGYMSSETVDYFMSPPNKPATNITIDTLRRFRVHESERGWCRGRAILPVAMRGALAGYAALAIPFACQTPDEYTKVLFPKHFRKSDYLYGFDEVAEDCPYIIIVEGQRDMMKCWQEGFGDCVAIMGGDLSERQIELLKMKTGGTIYMMLDGDEKGKEGTKKNVVKLKSAQYNDVWDAGVDGRDPKELDGRGIAKALRNARRMD